jgi:hypothetical protein
MVKTRKDALSHTKLIVCSAYQSRTKLKTHTPNCNPHATSMLMAATLS